MLQEKSCIVISSSFQKFLMESEKVKDIVYVFLFLWIIL